MADALFVRAIDPAGNVVTLAGQCITKPAFPGSCFNKPASMADGVGKNAMFAGINSHRDRLQRRDLPLDMIRALRKVTPTKCTGCTNASQWTWTTSTWIDSSNPGGIVDGPASVATFISAVSSAAIDSDNVIYFTGTGKWYRRSYIRRITPDGVVDTIAGNGPLGTETSGGYYTVPGPLPGNFRMSSGIAVDPTQKRLFFAGQDLQDVFVMPY